MGDLYDYIGRERPQVEFIEDGHKYILEGHEMPSVTQILGRQGISTDLSGAPQRLLEKKAEHGRLVHEEIETFVRTGEEGITDEFQDFLRLVHPLCGLWFAETMVATDRYCGRADLIGIDEEKREMLVVDTKTGQLNENATAWQTSMYAYPIADGFRLRCFAFDAKMGGASRLVELEPVSKSVINDLLYCDALGAAYDPIAVTVNDYMPILTAYDTTIAEMTTALKKLESLKGDVYRHIKREMERARVMSFDSPTLHITYTPSYSKSVIDSKRLKAERPDVYKSYLKESRVSSSITVTVKETVKANETKKEAV